VAARAVATVVPESDRFRQCNVEAERARHRGGNLGHFECVREARALVIVGEDEDLGLTSEASERGRVQDSVSVAFEARAPLIRSLFDRALPASE